MQYKKQAKVQNSHTFIKYHSRRDYTVYVLPISVPIPGFPWLSPGSIWCCPTCKAAHSTDLVYWGHDHQHSRNVHHLWKKDCHTQPQPHCVLWVVDTDSYISSIQPWVPKGCCPTLNLPWRKTCSCTSNYQDWHYLQQPLSECYFDWTACWSQ